MNRTTPMKPEGDVRETPPELFAALHARFRFTLDAASNHYNAQVPRYCTEDGQYARSYDGRSIALHALDGVGRRVSVVARSQAPEGVWSFRNLPSGEEDHMAHTPSHLYMDDRGDSRGYVRVSQVRHTELCESLPPVPGNLFGQHAGLLGEGASRGALHPRTEDDALGTKACWKGLRVFLNPPFSDIAGWLRRALISEAEAVVMLIPATRTEQPWWQEMIEPFRDRGQGMTVEFLPKRPRFLKDGVQMGSPKFGCCLVIIR